MSIKKIIYLCITAFSLFFIGCSDDIKETISKENIPKKISLLFITQAHCPSCDKLEATMKLKKPANLIKKYFEKKIIYLGEKIPENLAKPNGTPTVYFLGHNNELLIRPMIGEKDEASLTMFLEDALLEFKTVYNIDLTLKQEDNNETNRTNSTNSTKI
ncbi:MAG: hypothetical protein KAG56_00295 [Sulfurovaceae bacterium]|nr:hypothetical protein [Sulfurovaceae bacterium]